jgi:hypothetical protein
VSIAIYDHCISPCSTAYKAFEIAKSSFAVEGPAYQKDEEAGCCRLLKGKHRIEWKGIVFIFWKLVSVPVPMRRVKAVVTPAPAIPIPPAVTSARISIAAVVVGIPVPSVLIQVAPEFAVPLANLSTVVPNLAVVLSNLRSIARDLFPAGAASQIPSELGSVLVEFPHVPS